MVFIVSVLRKIGYSLTAAFIVSVYCLVGAQQSTAPVMRGDKVVITTLTPIERQRLAAAIDADLTLPDADREAIKKTLARIADQISKQDLDVLQQTSFKLDKELLLPPELAAKLKDRKKSVETGMSLPVFGKAKLEPFTDPLTRKAGMHLVFTKDGKTTFDVNTALLDEAKFDLIEEKMSAQGYVTIMGKKAQIGLKKVSLGESPFVIGEMVLQLRFGEMTKEKDPYTDEMVDKFKYDPLVITLPQGKNITVKAAYLTIAGSEGAPIVLSTKITIFGQKAKFSILFNLDAITAKLEIKKVPLVNLVPELKQSPLNNWQFKKAEILLDLWRAKFGRPEVAQIKSSRRLTCNGTIQKIPLVLPSDDAGSSFDYAQEESQEMLQEMVSEPSPDETASIMPANVQADNLVQGEAAKIDPTLLAEELPEPAPLDEDPSLNFTNELPPDNVDMTFVAEDTSADVAGVEDIPEQSYAEEYQEPEPEPETEFTAKLVVSRAGIRLNVRAQDLPINGVGILENAEISFIAERSRAGRPDLLQYYKNTDKKTLNQIGAQLEVTGDNLAIKNIGKLNNVQFLIGLTRKEREKPSDPEVVFRSLHGKISIGGSLSLDLDPIGKMDIDVLMSITRKGLFFSGTVNANLSYKELTLKQIKLTYGYPVLETEEQLMQDRLTLSREKGKQGERDAWRTRQDEKQKSALAQDIKLSTASTTTIEKGPKPRAKQKALSLIGTVKLYGITFMARADIRRDPDKLKKPSATFGFTALIKEIRPFATTELPTMKDIGMNDVIASIVTNPATKLPTVILSGKAAFGSVAFPVNLMIAIVRGQTKPCIIMFSDEIVNKSLASLIPGLPGGIDVVCSSAQLLVSTCKYDTTNLVLPEEIQRLLPKLIPKGLSVNGRVPLLGTLEKVGNFLGISKEHAFQLKGTFDFGGPLVKYSLAVLLSQEDLTELIYSQKRKNLLTSKVNADIKMEHAMTQMEQKMQAEMASYEDIEYDDAGNPLPPKEKPKFSFDSIGILIKNGPVLGGAPAIGIEVGVLFRPTQAELLSLKGALDFNGVTVDLGAQMLGTWRQPFGLKGWELTDVGLIAGFFPAPPPIPIKLGGAAQLKVNDWNLNFKFLVDMMTMNMALEGSTTRLYTFFDLFKLCIDSLGLNIPKVPMPLEIHDFKIRFAREEVKILDQFIEPGFELAGKINIFGKSGSFEGRVNDLGLKFYGSLEKIVIPNLFSLTDADGVKDPVIDVEMSLTRQKCLVSGMIGIGPGPLIKQKTFLDVSMSGAKAEFEAAIGDTLFENKPLLSAKVKCGIGGSFKDPQVDLYVQFQQNLQKFIRQAILNGVDSAKQQVIQGITRAQEDIKVLDAAQKANEQDINRMIQDVEKLKQVQQKFTDAEKEVLDKLKVLEDTVSDIDKQIESKKNWYYNLPKV